MSVFKHSSDLNLSIIKFLNTFSLYFIVYPHTFIFDLFVRLFVFTNAVKVAILKITSIYTAVLKRFFALTVWEIMLKLARVYRAISIYQCALSLFNAVPPLTLIRCSVLPPTRPKHIHLSMLPLAFIGPSTLFTLENTLARLETIYELAFINIAISPFSSALSIWIPV